MMNWIVSIECNDKAELSSAVSLHPFLIILSKAPVSEFQSSVLKWENNNKIIVLITDSIFILIVFCFVSFFETKH